MTIKNRLLINLGVTIFILLSFLGLVCFGAIQYDQHRQAAKLADLQLTNWMALNFQVSQYLNVSLRSVHSQEPLKDADLDAILDEIIHLFVVLDRVDRSRAEYLSQEEKQRLKDQLTQIREQFGLINASIEKAVALIAKHQPREALAEIQSKVLQNGVARDFVHLILTAVNEERAKTADLEREFIVFKKILFMLFIALVVIVLAAGIALMAQVNRAIHRSLQAAKNELLRGTDLIGAGNLDVQVDIDPHEELSVVADSFNKMSQHLRTARGVIEQQQAQLINSSKMSALGEMAGGVAHEINTPLATIKILSGQIRDVLNDPIPDLDLVGQKCGEIEGAVDRMAKVINGMRSFSRNSGSDPFSVVDVKSVVDETLSLCRSGFKDQGIEVIVETCPDSFQFEGRSSEIVQVLLNLLNNAKDAVLDLREKWIRLSMASDESYIDLIITDSGSGIPDSVKDRMFQPFFSTKELGKGTGLGLSVSMGIVRAHGGELSVDSFCDNTRFVIRLPKKQTK